MQSFHWVKLHDHTLDVCPECWGNPAKALCMTCKGFKQNGICAHVVAVNHKFSQKFNLKHNMKTMAGSKTNKRPGGNHQRHIPALLKAPLPPPISGSDDDSEPDDLPPPSSEEDEPLSKRVKATNGDSSSTSAPPPLGTWIAKMPKAKMPKEGKLPKAKIPKAKAKMPKAKMPKTTDSSDDEYY